MERSFQREIDALDRVFHFIDDFAAENATEPSVTMVMKLAVEELFTNMVKYNALSPHQITIGLDYDGQAVVMTLIDVDVDPFDIRMHGAVDVEAPLEDREIGGLGLYLVKNVVDEIYYHYQNRESKVTLIKRLDT